MTNRVLSLLCFYSVNYCFVIRMRQTPSAPNRKSSQFDVSVNILVTSEKFSVKGVSKETKVSTMKDQTELATGIPLQLQRLHYIDEGEMMDDQTLRSFGVVPGGLLKMKVWNEWNTLIEAVARNDIDKVFALGVTPDTNYKTAMSEYMTLPNKTKWLAERAFVALFVATHRGHQALCQKLIMSGADVNSKTASGRCPLHIAAALGNESVLNELLIGGADLEVKDKDGNTALDLAKQNGNKNCHRQLIKFEWLKRSKNKGPPSSHPLFAHQYFDSSLKTYLQGRIAQMYYQQILPPGEFQGTGLGAPRRKEKSPLSRKSQATSPELLEQLKTELGRNELLAELDSCNNEKSQVEGPAMKATTQVKSSRSKAMKSEVSSSNALKKINQRDNERKKTRQNDRTRISEKNNSENTEQELVGILETPRYEDSSKLGSFSEYLSGDLIDMVIAKKLQEQNEKGVHGLPYDLWLASRDNMELYQAVRDKGQLEAVLKY